MLNDVIFNQKRSFLAKKIELKQSLSNIRKFGRDSIEPGASKNTISSMNMLLRIQLIGSRNSWISSNGHQKHQT